MRIIHSGGFPDDERRQNRAVIYSNIIVAFKILLDIMDTEQIPFQEEKTRVGIFENCQTWRSYCQIINANNIIGSGECHWRGRSWCWFWCRLHWPQCQRRYGRNVAWFRRAAGCCTRTWICSSRQFALVRFAWKYWSVYKTITDIITASSDPSTVYSPLIGYPTTRICCILGYAPPELRRLFLNWVRWISAWWMLEDSDLRERNGFIVSRVCNVFSLWLLFPDMISAWLRTRLP